MVGLYIHPLIRRKILRRAAQWPPWKPQQHSACRVFRMSKWWRIEGAWTCLWVIWRLYMYIYMYYIILYIHIYIYIIIYIYIYCLLYRSGIFWILELIKFLAGDTFVTWEVSKHVLKPHLPPWFKITNEPRNDHLLDPEWSLRIVLELVVQNRQLQPESLCHVMICSQR